MRAGISSCRLLRSFNDEPTIDTSICSVTQAVYMGDFTATASATATREEGRSVTQNHQQKQLFASAKGSNRSNLQNTKGTKENEQTMTAAFVA